MQRSKGPSRNWVELQQKLEELRLSMMVDGAAPVRAKVKEIVPEYSYCDETPALNEHPIPVEQQLNAIGQN